MRGGPTGGTARRRRGRRSFSVVGAGISSDGICIRENERIVFANAAVRWMNVDPGGGIGGP